MACTKLRGNSPKCFNYRVFKTELLFENYLLNVPYKLRRVYTKFRCRNSKLPIETGTINNIVRDKRICMLCNNNQVGDEFHYLMQCVYFKKQREKYLGKINANFYCMKRVFKKEGIERINLCRFILEIMQIF